MNSRFRDSYPRLVSARAFLLIAAALAAGCGVNGSAWRPMLAPADRSVIYMYRPYQFIGSESAPLVTCGPETIELEAGGYYAFLANGGAIVCSAANAPTLRFDAHSGSAYFIREEIESGAPRLSLVNESAGRDEIKSTRLQAPTSPVDR